MKNELDLDLIRVKFLVSPKDGHAVVLNVDIGVFPEFISSNIIMETVR